MEWRIRHAGVIEQLKDLLYQRQKDNPKQRYFDVIATIDCDEIGHMCTFLHQFKVLTKSLEGDEKETLSFVWPTYMNLESMLQPDPDSEGDYGLSVVEQMKTNGLSYFTSRIRDFKPRMTHKVATFLNPIFKSLQSVAEAEKN